MYSNRAISGVYRDFRHETIGEKLQVIHKRIGNITYPGAVCPLGRIGSGRYFGDYVRSQTRRASLDEHRSGESEGRGADAAVRGDVPVIHAGQRFNVVENALRRLAHLRAGL